MITYVIQLYLFSSMAVPQTLIYHITHIDNLQGIIARGGLQSYKLLQDSNISYVNVAHQNIQDRRATTQVPCGQGETLHDYVPFYFASRSPMLYAIYKGIVEGYSDGQKSVIYLVSVAEEIEKAKHSFVFTDGHATVAYTSFFDNLNRLSEIDWNVMKSKYWNDDFQHIDRKRQRQAEFLIHRTCPWELILGVAVISETMKTRTEAILSTTTHKPKLVIRPDWYY